MTPEEQENLLRYYIKENYKLKAQMFALQSMTLNILSMGNYDKLLELKKIYQKEIQTAYEELIANDPLLEQSWKKMIQKDLGDLPGIDL